MVIGIKGQLRDQEIEHLRIRLSEAEQHLTKARERNEPNLVGYEDGVLVIKDQINALLDTRVG